MAEKKKYSDKPIKAGKTNIVISNHDKLYWPKEKISKYDLAAYYTSVAPVMLPYLKNRPMSLNRFPEGIGGFSFYQKDIDIKHLPPFASYQAVYSESNKKTINYLICNNAETLVYMANLGCIEMNPWLSKIDKPDAPDFSVLDLDPGKIDFKYVVECALVIKEVLDEMKIKSFCKTSGSSGIHIYVPLGAKYDYDTSRIFAQYVASVVQKKLPKTTSIERTVSKRTTKIYIDYLQNSRGQTIAAAYSARPKPGATVSAPLEWNEVNDGLRISNFTIFNMPDRIKKKGDLWDGIMKVKNDLSRIKEPGTKNQEILRRKSSI